MVFGSCFRMLAVILVSDFYFYFLLICQFVSTDPVLESVGLGETKELEHEEAEVDAVEEEEDNKPYFVVP